MKSIGIYNSQNIPISNDEYGQLLDYTKDDVLMNEQKHTKCLKYMNTNISIQQIN